MLTRLRKFFFLHSAGPQLGICLHLYNSRSEFHHLLDFSLPVLAPKTQITLNTCSFYLAISMLFLKIQMTSRRLGVVFSFIGLIKFIFILSWYYIYIYLFNRCCCPEWHMGKPDIASHAYKCEVANLSTSATRMSFQRVSSNRCKLAVE